MGEKIKLFDKEVLDVNIVHVDDGDKNGIFTKSGTKHLLNKVSVALSNFNPQLIFLEHSYFCTTLNKNNYKIYVGVETANGYSLDKDSLKSLKFFFSTLNENFEIKFPILFHPDFIKCKINEFLFSENKINGDFFPKTK